MKHKKINNIIYEIFIIYTCSNGKYPSKKIIVDELRKRLLQKNRIYYFPVKKMKRLIPGDIRSRYLLSAQAAMVYLIVSAFNYSQRRIMFLYPIIFIMSFTVIQNSTRSRKIFVLSTVALLYLLLTFIYVFIK